MLHYFHSKLTIVVFSLTLMIACKKESSEDSLIVSTQKDTSKTKISVCATDFSFLKSYQNTGVFRSDAIQTVFKDRAAWTNGQTIKVRFLNDVSNYSAKDLVKNCFAEWARYVNLYFVYVDDNDASADISIQFNNQGNNSSKIGTDSKGQGPSLNLDASSNRRVILHEIGHALGLRHEHQNPNHTIKWNKQAVYDYYYTNFNWSHAMTDWNVLDPAPRSETSSSIFDPSSIMIYSFPSRLTLDGYSVGWPSNLSIQDKKGILEMYPFPTRQYIRSSAENGYYISKKKSDDLWVGEQLKKGQYLESENGIFRFHFQGDGNAVIINTQTNKVIWSTGTALMDITNTLTITEDYGITLMHIGGLPLYSTHKSLHKASFPTFPSAIPNFLMCAYLKMQNDGNLVLYDRINKIAWASGSNSKYFNFPASSTLLNQRLSAGQSITSSNGRYRLTMQPDGNLVAFQSDGRFYWSSGTWASGTGGNRFAAMQSDGNFVIYDGEGGRALWATGTNNNQGQAFLLLQDDGNIVIYNNQLKALWASGPK